MKRLLVILGILLFGFGVAEAKTIRLLILKDKKEVNISAPNKLEITDGDRVPILITGQSRARCTIGLSNGRLLIAGIKGSRGPILIRSDSSSPLWVDGRRYRGEIEIRRGQAGIDVINIIDLEEYLYGVIKWEICPSWPMEAVKAQAVVARTFAYYNLGRHAKDGYDLCRTYHCQVCGGMDSEDPRSIEAVDATRGEVLTYKGELANSIYHATCGGYTTCASLVWQGKGFEYLKSVACHFCHKSPHYSWFYQIKLSEIVAKLKNIGYNLGRIYRIYPSKKDKFGRAGELTILHSRGRTKIKAEAFRMALGPEKTKSTRFEVTRRGDSIIFNGLGWGHGVGMCQWGAKRMAELGFSYGEILEYYYPGTTISKIVKFDLDNEN